MAKIVRHTYPKEFSIGLLLVIFALSTFLSSQIFEVSWSELMDGSDVLMGMLLVGVAVVIMALILWEEFLFPVHIVPAEDHVTFRNHQTKLITQIIIYCLIPAIFIFLFFEYEIDYVRFTICAGICIIAPVAGRLMSGIKNYNDFLKLTNDAIEYQNNEKKGVIHVRDLDFIALIKDEMKVLHKVRLHMKDNTEVMIDLDEMELEAYYKTINEFIIGHYKELVK